MSEEVTKKRKRRPGRDAHTVSASDAVTNPVNDSETETTTETVKAQVESQAEHQQEPPPSPFHDEPERKHVNIDFVGVEILKEKAPKVFDLAQTVADEWVNDGSFTDLKLGHPVAEMVASIGLREAKKIEKKLEEKGVFALAKMGLDYAKNRWKK